MTEDQFLDTLRSKLEHLSRYEAEAVERYVDALRIPVESEVNPESWLGTSSWAGAFLTRLRAHHALSGQPLTTGAFETAFDDACRAAGWTVEPAGSATNRFFDTVVVTESSRKRVSLKATSARALSRSSVHISKLTEAAWIQDARTQTSRQEKLIGLFRAYRDETDSIVVLRCFRGDETVLEYELLEIPTEIFASVDGLSVSDAQLATIPIPPGSDKPVARIRVDRSDAKITVTGIPIDACIVHCRWRIPIAGQASPATYV